MDALNEAKKGTRPPKTKISAKGSKPDFLDMDKDGDKKEPMKKAVADKKAGPKKGVNPFAKVKEDDTDRKPSKETSRTVKMKKQGGGDVDVNVRKVQGWQSQKADKTSDKEKDLDEGKSCSEGHTKMTKGCKECAGMWESKKAKPDFLDMDKDGNKKEPMKKAVKDKKKVKESQFNHNVRFVNESLQFLLQEDEEGKAKAITAAGDMVNDFTSWMQRVGQYQTKTMIELADAIKADFGAQESETFKQSVGPALSATLEVLTQQRETISNAVAVLAGEAAPEIPMGAEPGMEPGMDSAGPDMMNPPAGDEFAGADAAAGGAEVTGRAMRESKEQRRARKLSEAHSIMSKLAR